MMQVKSLCAVHFKLTQGDFPGGPVAKTLHTNTGARVWFLVGEQDPARCNKDQRSWEQQLKTQQDQINKY